MINIYKKIVPQPIRFFIRSVFCIIRFFPQHVFSVINIIFTRKNIFEHNLAIMAIIKNEAPYLKEWIEYHRIVGIEKFILYDNESNDNTKEILEPYIDTGIVDYTYYPGYKMQILANNDAINKWKKRIKFIAMIDADEFIVPVQNDTIIQVLNDVEEKMKARKKLFVGLVIKWVNYGFNGHYSKPDGLVTENYKKSDGISLCHKTIINPRMVIRYQVHDGIYLLSYFGVDENEKKITGFIEPTMATVNKIRINHYFTKSYEEFKIKHSKGDAVYGKRDWNVSEYDPNYLSHNEDSIMNRFIPLLKQKLSAGRINEN
jgi:hypothetical protein